jgi:hypothetical protein
MNNHMMNPISKKELKVNIWTDILEVSQEKILRVNSNIFKWYSVWLQGKHLLQYRSADFIVSMKQ